LKGGVPGQFIRSNSTLNIDLPQSQRVVPASPLCQTFVNAVSSFKYNTYRDCRSQDAGSDSRETHVGPPQEPVDKGIRNFGGIGELPKILMPESSRHLFQSPAGGNGRARAIDAVAGAIAAEFVWHPQELLPYGFCPHRSSSK